MSRAELDAVRVKLVDILTELRGHVDITMPGDRYRELSVRVEAALASQAPVVQQAPRCLLAPLPDWTKYGDLGGRVPGEVRQAMHDYARASWEISVASQAPAVQQAVALTDEQIEIVKRSAHRLGSSGFTGLSQELRAILADNPAPAARQEELEAIHMLKREIHNLKRHIEDYCPSQPVQQAVALTNGLVVALQDLVDEFIKVYPIYYYAEPWNRKNNEALKLARAALAAAKGGAQ